MSATTPTTLFAYSREGVLKWKRTEQFVAGELAVARGVLDLRAAQQAYVAAGQGDEFWAGRATTSLGA